MIGQTVSHYKILEKIGLVIKGAEQGAAQINVVLNWFEELKRLVPTD